MENLLQNRANINEKRVKNISVGETDDLEREREGAGRGGTEREKGELCNQEGKSKLVAIV